MSNKQHTPEEKAFNAAQCSICLLDWPMAQCLACKFHQPETEVEFNPQTMEMHMYNGWTPQLSQKILDATERATLEVYVAEQPENEYWRGMLESFNEAHPVEEAQAIADAEKNADELANDARWLDSDLCVNSDPRTPEQIALDEWQDEASDVGYGKNGRPQ